MVVLGGRAPGYIRLNEKVLEMVRHFDEHDEPIAAVCHAVQLLGAAGVLKGRSCTGYPACGPEARLAGANWVEVEMNQSDVDRNLVTSPAWPAHPAWIASFLEVLGTTITHREAVPA